MYRRWHRDPSHKKINRILEAAFGLLCYTEKYFSTLISLIQSHFGTFVSVLFVILKFRGLLKPRTESSRVFSAFRLHTCFGSKLLKASETCELVHWTAFSSSLNPGRAVLCAFLLPSGNTVVVHCFDPAVNILQQDSMCVHHPSSNLCLSKTQTQRKSVGLSWNSAEHPSC